MAEQKDEIATMKAQIELLTDVLEGIASTMPLELKKKVAKNISAKSSPTAADKKVYETLKKRLKNAFR